MSGSAVEAYCPRCAGRLLLDTTGTPEAGQGPAPGAAGLRLGEYEVREEMGRGAMGVVYRAWHPRLRREVAVKMILAAKFAGESARQRFLTEAELTARLDHPNIVPIYEVGETAEGPFYAMRLVEGAPLSARLTRSDPGLKEAEAAALVAKIARAVHHAHQRGVLHRDLKPANILIDKSGEPHITDFGLARNLQAEAGMTLTGDTLGTPAYMSPEQAAGGRGVTTASDVWSLGAMLYHLLCGRPPFAAATVTEILVQLQLKEVASPRQLRPAISADLDTICLKCLQKDPAQRYFSALALAEDIESAMRQEPIRARRSSMPERVVKWARRRPAVAGLAAAVIVAAVAGVTGIAWQWRRAEGALASTRAALWQAYFDRAHALRTSGKMGQRNEALKAIAAAAALRPTPELREEAIAALALTDLAAAPGSGGPPDNLPRTESEETGETSEFVAAVAGDVWRIRERSTGKTLVELPGGTKPALSADQNAIAWFAASNVIVCRGLRQSNELGRLEIEGGSGQTYRTIALSGDLYGDRLLEVELEKECRIWRLSDHRQIAAQPLPDRSICAGWAPHDAVVALGCEDGNLYVWDALSNRLVKHSGSRREGVLPWFHPSGRLVASVAWDDVLRLWDPGVEGELMETDVGRPLSFSGDGETLDVRNSGGRLRLNVCLPTECRLLHAPLGLSQLFWTVAFTPDDEFVAAGNMDGAWIWNVASGRPVADLPLRLTRSLRFLDPGTLLSSSAEGVLLWTNASPAQGWKPALKSTLVSGDTGRISDAELAGNHLALAVRHEEMVGAIVHDFASGRELFRLTGQPFFEQLSWSADAKWIASGYFDNSGNSRSQLWIWSGADGQPALRLPMGNCHPLFSPDGRWFLACNPTEYQQFAVDGPPQNWRVTRRFARHVSGRVAGTAAFSEDGKWLALEADVRIIRLLDASTGQELTRFTPLPQAWRSGYPVFSHHGRCLSISTDIGLNVWDLPALRARLQQMRLDWD